MRRRYTPKYKREVVMNYTTLADSFDKFKLLTEVTYETTGKKDITCKLTSGNTALSATDRLHQR